MKIPLKPILLLSIVVLFSCNNLTSNKKSPLNRFQNSKSKYRNVNTTPKQKLNFDFNAVESSWLAKYPEINTEFTKNILGEKETIKNQAQAFALEFPNSNLLPFKFYIDELKKFNPQSKDIVSVRTQVYNYTGGAHGQTYHKSWNWDKKENRFLSIKDIVKTPNQVKQLIDSTRKALYEKLHVNSSTESLSDKNSIDSGTSQIETFKVWNLDQNDILVVFDPYEVGHYSTGYVEVRVPRP